MAKWFSCPKCNYPNSTMTRKDICMKCGYDLKEYKIKMREERMKYTKKPPKTLIKHTKKIIHKELDKIRASSCTCVNKT